MFKTYNVIKPTKTILLKHLIMKDMNDVQGNQQRPDECKPNGLRNTLSPLLDDWVGNEHTNYPNCCNNNVPHKLKIFSQLNV